MIDTIYVEEQVRDHPRTAAIRSKYPRALEIPIERYGEVFNRHAQNFRLQKRRPSLVLARRHARRLLPAPYGIGGEHNYYFSHVLNCLYDCRYCFLQGRYRSAHYVLFVNYEDFQRDIEAAGQRLEGKDVYFFSGSDGDSLALEPITGFVDAFLPFFHRHPRWFFELRTKSVAIRPLLRHEPIPNCIAAFSFTPEEARRSLEHEVPPVAERVSAASRVAERGFRVGLRFDPLLYGPRYREHYRRLFGQVFQSMDVSSLHSVSLGPFRLPRDYFQRMIRLYPEEPLFAGPLEERAGTISYPEALEEEMRQFCVDELSRYVPREILFPCQIEVQ